MSAYPPNAGPVEGDAFTAAMRVLGELRTVIDSPKPMTDLAKREKVHELTDQIETITRAYLADVAPQETWLPYKLSNLESRLCNLLYAKFGHVVRFETMLDALYFDRNPDEVPQQKLLDVLKWHVNRKLIRSSAPVRLENVWGIGIKMVRTEDWNPYPNLRCRNAAKTRSAKARAKGRAQ